MNRTGHRWGRVAAGIACCLILLQAPAGLAQEEQTQEAVRSVLPPEMTTLMPIGREFTGVVIPSYSGTAIKYVIRADKVVRVDERFMDLTKLEIAVYNEAGQADTFISMDLAKYELAAGEMVSQTPAKIAGKQFTMTGDVMTFDIQSQKSVMEGNVVLIVPEISKMTPGFGRKSPAAEPDGEAPAPDVPGSLAPGPDATIQPAPATISVP